jgi:hypothetical protein
MVYKSVTLLVHVIVNEEICHYRTMKEDITKAMHHANLRNVFRAVPHPPDFDDT